MIHKDKTTRNYDEESKSIAKICLSCPYNKCLEDIYKGVQSNAKCDYYNEEFKKLQEKYGHKRIGHYNN